MKPEISTNIQFYNKLFGNNMMWTEEKLRDYINMHWCENLNDRYADRQTADWEKSEPGGEQIHS